MKPDKELPERYTDPTTGIKYFQCQNCPKKFARQAHLDYHQKSIHFGAHQPYKCKTCGQKFSQNFSLRRHYARAHFGQYSYICDECGLGFHHKFHLRVHYSMDHFINNPPIIRRVALDASSEMYRSLHPNLDMRSNPGQVEDATTNHGHSVDAIGMSEKMVTRPQGCSGRDDKQYERCSIKVDDSSSEVERLKHQCKECSRKFPRKRSLYLHMLADHIEKVESHMCPECGCHFSEKTHLKVHLQIVHNTLHNPGKGNSAEDSDIDRSNTFRCGKCSKSFRGYCDLSRHLMTHTGVQPYVCSLCGRGFGQWSSLKRHWLVHTGEQPFECECGKKFSRRSHLHRHMLNIHRSTGDEPILTYNDSAKKNISGTIHEEETAMASLEADADLPDEAKYVTDIHQAAISENSFQSSFDKAMLDATSDHLASSAIGQSHNEFILGVLCKEEPQESFNMEHEVKFNPNLQVKQERLVDEFEVSIPESDLGNLCFAVPQCADAVKHECFSVDEGISPNIGDLSMDVTPKLDEYILSVQTNDSENSPQNAKMKGSSDNVAVQKTKTKLGVHFSDLTSDEEDNCNDMEFMEDEEQNMDQTNVLLNPREHPILLDFLIENEVSTEESNYEDKVKDHPTKVCNNKDSKRLDTSFTPMKRQNTKMKVASHNIQVQKKKTKLGVHFSNLSPDEDDSKNMESVEDEKRNLDTINVILNPEEHQISLDFLIENEDSKNLKSVEDEKRNLDTITVILNPEEHQISLDFLIENEDWTDESDKNKVEDHPTKVCNNKESNRLGTSFTPMKPQNTKMKGSSHNTAVKTKRLVLGVHFSDLPSDEEDSSKDTDSIEDEEQNQDRTNVLLNPEDQISMNFLAENEDWTEESDYVDKVMDHPTKVWNNNDSERRDTSFKPMKPHNTKRKHSSDNIEVQKKKTTLGVIFSDLTSDEEDSSKDTESVEDEEQNLDKSNVHLNPGEHQITVDFLAENEDSTKKSGYEDKVEVLPTKVCHNKESKRLDMSFKHTNPGYLTNKPYTCIFCELHFKRMCHLKTHLQIHTEERPFDCPECDMKFSQRSVLKRHLKTHKKLQPYFCVQCSRRFSQLTHLERHLDVHFKQTNVSEVS